MTACPWGITACANRLWRAQPPLYRQVYILGRMGARLRALRLIINQLADIPQVKGGIGGNSLICMRDCRELPPPTCWRLSPWLGLPGAAARLIACSFLLIDRRLIVHGLGQALCWGADWCTPPTSRSQAIEFVRESRDEELWEHLITWALSSPNTTGGSAHGQLKS